MTKYRVGQVRPSQLLWTYGPGALIDLPNLSAITMGLDRWDKDRCPSVEEERLLAAVRRVLGPQVTHLRIPPYIADEGVDPLSAEANVGTPVRPFPRWLRCVKCGLLADFDSDLFKIKENRFRPENTHFVHANCERGSNADAVPARFLLACRNGHLDDFPWHWFVHAGSSDCKGTLRFFERGASLQTENLWVKCDTCNRSRSLVHAFGREGRTIYLHVVADIPILIDMNPNAKSRRGRSFLVRPTAGFLSPCRFSGYQSIVIRSCKSSLMVGNILKTWSRKRKPVSF